MRVVLVAVMLLAFSARAEDPQVQPVRQLFEDGEFDAAVKKADAAVGRAATPADAAALYVLKGRALLARGDTNKARVAFIAALKKDAGVTLDPSRAGQEAVDLLQSAREELQATVTLVVPNGSATIRCDDKPLGPAPLTVRLPAGRHTFEANSSDGRSGKVEQVLGANAKQTLSIELGSSTPPIEMKRPAEPVAAATTGDTAPPPPPPPEVSSRVERRSFVGLIPIVGGAVVAGAGAGCLVASGQQFARLTSGEKLDETTSKQAASSGATLQTLGWVGIGVGAAALATGVVMLFVVKDSAPPPVEVSLSVTPQGSYLGVQGHF